MFRNQRSSDIGEQQVENLILHAVRQVLDSALEDTSKYSLAVKNLESMLIKKLRDDGTYKKAIDDKEIELNSKYPSRKDIDKKRRLLTEFKFQELMVRLDDLIEREMDVDM